MAITTEVFYTTNASLPEELSEWELATEPYISKMETIPGLAAGLYYVKVRYTNGIEDTAFSPVYTVTIANPPVGNTPPIASAGADNTITLPTNSVTLVGSGTDSDGSIASYAWSKVSGGAATITTPNAATTTVTGLVEGAYVFRLTVTDNQGATHTDEVSITVLPVPVSFSTTGDAVIMKEAVSGVDTVGQNMMALNSTEAFNVGSDNFALVWKGFLLSIPTSSARLVSKATGTSGPFLYMDINGKIFGAFRNGSAASHLFRYDTPLVAGENYTFIFQRKGGTSGNLTPSDYELIVNGVTVPVVTSVTTLTTANIDNTNPYYIGYAGTGGSPFAAHELGGFYKRFLTSGEIADTLNNEFPSDGAIWTLKNTAFSGTQINSTGTLALEGVLQNFPAASTAAGTQLVFSRGRTAIKLKPGITAASKVMTSAETLTKIICWASGGLTSITYKVYNASNTELSSNTVTLTAADTNATTATIPTLNIAAGHRLEVVRVGSTNTALLSFF